MAETLVKPGTIEWLPMRLTCPDGRLRMINVRHVWTGAEYLPSEDACGRLPAVAPNYQGFRHVAGFCAGEDFYLRKED